ncbi:hypothetical protein [Halomonas sp. 18071143]|uniref:hypothetical protein n=1 Tax=Halomonas sp. 18071143 TaxID=2855441 RepID=UPI001C484889|nr:hypothetical protein [Halomonas sp. 18071143]
MWVGFFGDPGNADETAAAATAATCASAGSSSIKEVEQVTVFIFKGGKQGFQVIVLGAGIGGDNGVCVQLRGNGDFLATLDHVGAGAVGKVQLDAAIGGGNECFPLLNDVTNAQFTQVAIFVACPCLT